MAEALVLFREVDIKGVVLPEKVVYIRTQGNPVVLNIDGAHAPR